MKCPIALICKKYFSISKLIIFDEISNFSEKEDDNKDDEAVVFYERILKINPEHREAYEAVNSIKGLAKDAEEHGIDIK